MVDVALHLERWPSHSNSLSKQQGYQAIQMHWGFQRTGDQVVGGGWSFQEMGVSKPFKQVDVSNKQVSKSFEWADVSNNRLPSRSNSWQRACKQKAVQVLFWWEVTFISSQMQFNACVASGGWVPMGQRAVTAIHPEAEEHPQAYQPSTQPRAHLSHWRQKPRGVKWTNPQKNK